MKKIAVFLVVVLSAVFALAQNPLPIIWQEIGSGNRKAMLNAGPTKTISASTAAIAEGYYAATNLAEVDTDLVEGNIKDTVTIFGVLGTYTGEGGAYPCPAYKTGQTISYAAYDDGWYGSNVGTAIPDPRFTVLTDTNCIRDNLTGLIWAQDAGITNGATWEAAIGFCEGLEYGGKTDWRMPNIVEMRSLANYFANSAPALQSDHPFGNILDLVGNYSYLTSTTDAGNTDQAWGFGPGWGESYIKPKASAEYNVWPVRGP